MKHPILAAVFTTGIALLTTTAALIGDHQLPRTDEEWLTNVYVASSMLIGAPLAFLVFEAKWLRFVSYAAMATLAALAIHPNRLMLLATFGMFIVFTISTTLMRAIERRSSP